ncbi:MAG: hypothetical protein MHM6MM_004770 [Cercozoa sp. M6MM]
MDEGTGERPVIEVWQNTYQLDPSFEWKRIDAKKIVREVMDEILTHVTYDSDEAAKLARLVAAKIRSRLKAELDAPRHRHVVQVIIGERREQGVRVGSRCLWDDKRDRYVSVNFQNKTLFATAIVFGIYFE